MCGINLRIDKRAGAVDPGRLRRANHLIRHRGPDDEQVYCWQNLGLGFVRLSILDLVTGQQPFFSEDRSKVLICNGEIYNYRILRDELREKGHRFSTQSDCEVILHLYEDASDRFVGRLQGMFAFVLLDQERGLVILGRDRTGMKPLCYADQEGVFACSSEVRGLRPLLDSRPGLDGRAMRDAFVFGYCPGDGTAFAGVRQVPPAHLLTYSLRTNTLALTEYWQPEFAPAAAKQKTPIGVYASGLRERLSRAVASHAMGDVPISAYLSGGIDSTIVTSLLQQALPGASPLAAFSIGFRDPAYDESEIFGETARVLGLDARVVTLDQVSADDFIAAVRVLEQPQFNTLDIPMQRLAALVRQDGRKVVLAGEGSDELFGGYVCFVLNQVRRALFLPLVRPLRGPLLRRAVEYFLGRGPFGERVAQTYLTEKDEVVHRFGTYPAWYPWWSINDCRRRGLFLDRDYEPLGEQGAFMGPMNRIRAASAPLGEYEKSLYIELKTRLPNYILSRADRNAMHSSVEVRLPFLDHEAMDYALTIPEGYKLYALQEKYILRKAFEGLVPAHVVNRRKQGYAAPNDWIWERQTEQSRELLSAQSLERTGLFDVAAVQRLLASVNGGAYPTDSEECQEHLTQLTGVLAVQALSLDA